MERGEHVVGAIDVGGQQIPNTAPRRHHLAKRRQMNDGIRVHGGRCAIERGAVADIGANMRARRFIEGRRPQPGNDAQVRGDESFRAGDKRLCHFACTSKDTTECLGIRYSNCGPTLFKSSDRSVISVGAPLLNRGLRSSEACGAQLAPFGSSVPVLASIPVPLSIHATPLAFSFAEST